MAEAQAAGVPVAVCSAATKGAVVFVLDNLLGKERFAALDLFMAGDDVKEKKPNPLIYQVGWVAWVDQLWVDERAGLGGWPSVLGAWCVDFFKAWWPNCSSELSHLLPHCAAAGGGAAAGRGPRVLPGH